MSWSTPSNLKRSGPVFPGGLCGYRASELSARQNYFQHLRNFSVFLVWWPKSQINFSILLWWKFVLKFIQLEETSITLLMFLRIPALLAVSFPGAARLSSKPWKCLFYSLFLQVSRFGWPPIGAFYGYLVLARFLKTASFSAGFFLG